MDEILRHLPAGALVLDLGCGTGSFRAGAYRVTAIRLDVERPSARGERFVQADAARLPFPRRSFHAVISNHSLEHFTDLDGALREMGRVVRPDGALYIAVPDSATLADRIYRWLGRGGGHVNPFRSAGEVAAIVERLTGLPLAATRTLHTSFSFLNRRNAKTRPPLRLLLVGGGDERVLRAASYLFRMVDRRLGTRASVYGWALYFGRILETIDTRAWTNVCVRCGAGHAAAWLEMQGLVRRTWRARWFACPTCGATNLFTADV